MFWFDTLAGSLMRKLKIASLGIFCVAVPIALAIGIRVVTTLTPAAQWGFTNGELVTTLLTGLTISIAVLASVIALVAVWGYHAIKDEAGGLAKSAAQTAAQVYLSQIAIETRIRELALPIIAEEIDKAMQTLEMTHPPIDTAGRMDSGEETEKVGEPYPDDKEA